MLSNMEIRELAGPMEEVSGRCKSRSVMDEFMLSVSWLGRLAMREWSWVGVRVAWARALAPVWLGLGVPDLVAARVAAIREAFFLPGDADLGSGWR